MQRSARPPRARVPWWRRVVGGVGLALVISVLTISWVRRPKARDEVRVFSGSQAATGGRMEPTTVAVASGLENDWLRDLAGREELADVLRLRLLKPGGRDDARVVITWLARTSPVRALELAREVFGAGEEGRELRERIASEYAEAIAEELLEAYVVTRNANAIRAVMQRWTREDVAPVLTHALFARMEVGLLSEPAQERVEWLAALPSSGVRDAAMARATASWAEGAPEAALAWSLERAGTAREMASTAALATWARREPLAAANWLATHDEEPRADRRILRWVEHHALVQGNPHVAVAWAELIRDQPMRERALHAAVLAWAQQDRAGALRYLDDTERLDARAKQAWRESLTAQLGADAAK